VKNQKATRQDEFYRDAAAQFGPALGRLVNGYERDPHHCQDLLQEIHLELWRSFARYEERCSLRTWVYRIAHNTATTFVVRQKRKKWGSMMGLEEVIELPDASDAVHEVEQRDLLDRVMTLIHLLKPVDRQVMLLYLEGLDAASMGEVTGLTAGAVATKVHRIKKVLARSFNAGGSHE
jgi:RNA polymerase sigma-70 factor, ECF subfamily